MREAPAGARARRLIMWNLVTLDGFFEGAKPWDLGWHGYVWGEELEAFSLEQLRSAGGLVFGRATYLGMASHWPTATGDVAELMNALPKVVFSRTLQAADWNNTTIARGDAPAEIARLKERPGKDLLVFGSADLCASLARGGAIDEYRLGVVPVVLGAGTPLFKPGAERRMRLVDARALRSGCVILRYLPDGAHD